MCCLPNVESRTNCSPIKCVCVCHLATRCAHFSLHRLQILWISILSANDSLWSQGNGPSRWGEGSKRSPRLSFTTKMQSSLLNLMKQSHPQTHNVQYNYFRAEGGIQSKIFLEIEADFLICMSFLLRGRANPLCQVPVLAYVLPKWTHSLKSSQRKHTAASLYAQPCKLINTWCQGLRRNGRSCVSGIRSSKTYASPSATDLGTSHESLISSWPSLFHPLKELE